MKSREQAQETDVIRVRFEVKSLDSMTGDFTGYAAAWDNVDRVGDRLIKGAFADTLAEWTARDTLPRVLWQHRLTIGHTTDLAEDPRGLLASGRLWLNVPEVKALVEGDILPSMPHVGMSFRFLPREVEHKADGGRLLVRLDLLDDITISRRPVNDRAALLEIKSADGAVVAAVPTARDLELILRDAGISRSSAKAIIAHGYDAALREAKSDEPALTEEAVSTLGEIREALERMNRSI
jgi:hypothetical protein